MTVIVPKLTEKGEMEVVKPLTEGKDKYAPGSLLDKFEKGDLDGILLLKNKTPVWNPSTKQNNNKMCSFFFQRLNHMF